VNRESKGSKRQKGVKPILQCKVRDIFQSMPMPQRIEYGDAIGLVMN